MDKEAKAQKIRLRFVSILQNPKPKIEISSEAEAWMIEEINHMTYEKLIEMKRDLRIEKKRQIRSQKFPKYVFDTMKNMCNII
jgi:uncharacterized protein YfeS